MNATNVYATWRLSNKACHSLAWASAFFCNFEGYIKIFSALAVKTHLIEESLLIFVWNICIPSKLLQMPCCHHVVQSGNAMAHADNIACVMPKIHERELFKFGFEFYQFFTQILEIPYLANFSICAPLV